LALSTSQPAQDAELGFRVAQAVEHHHPQQVLGIELSPTPTQQAPEGIGKTELTPQGMQQPGIAHRRGEIDRPGALLQCWLARGAQQAIEQRIAAAGLNVLQTPQGRDDPLAGDAPLVAERLDELDVLARTGGGDLHEHVVTLSPPQFKWKGLRKISCHYTENSARAITD